jgi:dUTP pyrophosphatase
MIPTEWYTMNMNLKIYKHRNYAVEPSYGTEQAACFDLSAAIGYGSAVLSYSKTNQKIEILASQENDKNYIDIPSEWRILVPTGLIFDIPENHYVRLYARSGLSTKQGLNLINSVGIIDADYINEVFIPIYNNSQEKIRIYSGDRIAQAEMVQCEPRVNFSYIDERPRAKGDRSGGFGSTGV